MRDKIKEREKNRRWRESHPNYIREWHEARRHPCQHSGCLVFVSGDAKYCVLHAGLVRRKSRPEILFSSTAPLDPLPIPMTRELIAFVDAVDYEAVMEYPWRPAKPCNIIYAVTSLPRSLGHGCLYLHQLIAQRMGISGLIDHRDCDGLNNSRNNLRIATPTQNAANTLRPRGASRFKGVARATETQKWRAYIRIDEKQVHLGTFETEEEAACAYDAAAIRAWGEYAKTNIQ